jgi:Arm DNA-binding domain
MSYGLTIKSIERLRNKPGRYRDARSRGLYLQVMSSSNASWYFRYERGGRERMMGLGPLDVVTLEEARDKAHTARKALYAGIDPIDQKHASGAQVINNVNW